MELDERQVDLPSSDIADGGAPEPVASATPAPALGSALQRARRSAASVASAPVDPNVDRVQRAPVGVPSVRSDPMSRVRRMIAPDAVVHRKVDKSTDDSTGPKADIPDSSLGGDVATRATDTFKLIKAGTAKADHPYVKARTDANGGTMPNSAKRFKWGVVHHNRDGDLPGVAGAGGFTEYYISNGPDASGSATSAERFVVQNSNKAAFHTATHYGRDGSPAFTHYGAA